MRTVLTKDLPIERLAVFAEMAWLVRRPELQLLCLQARAANGRFTTATVQAVLPGLGDVGCQNVIAACQSLRLCDAGGSLTTLGETVADNGDAPVPEQGVYDFWLTAHPLLGQRLLHAERLAATRDNRVDSLEPLPITPDRDVTFVSAVDAQQRMVVRDLPTNHGRPCCVRAASRSHGRLTWRLDFAEHTTAWQFEGQLEGDHTTRPAHLPPQDHAIDLRALANHWGMGPLQAHGRWSSSDQRLAVAAGAATADEQDLFLKTLRLPAVEVPGVDTFADVTLEAVPIGPLSTVDANIWAKGRLLRALHRHPDARSRGAVRALFAELVEETPLRPWDPGLPSHTGLLAVVAPDLPLWWSLRAAVDLAPQPVTAEDLAEFRLSAAPAPSQSVSNLAFALPYRHGSSMQQVVAHLLDGAVPKHLLLCDRYVRGADNLSMLQVFVDALKAIHPAVVVEVWSGEEEFDAKLVHKIAGGPARTYRSVFGNDWPHDRFVAVRPQTGAGFAWNLTNSPLHARADVSAPTPTTALRWKDLAAIRLAPEQLQPAMNRWLQGA